MAQAHPFYFDLEEHNFYARPLVSTDKKKFAQAFKKLSTQSVYLRFFTAQKNLSEKQLKYLTEVDGVHHISWTIIDTTGIEDKGVAVCRMIRMKEEPNIAEVAITVIDEYQKMGIGAILLAILNILATNNDIKFFRYYVLHQNKFVIDILNDLGIIEQSYDGDLVKIDALVRPSHKDIPDKISLKGFKKTMQWIESLIF
jgi:hypothetical protein